MYDCVIIGGGIGGLSAGIYLSRFNLRTCIIDNKQSRASLITQSQNFPGFPQGVSGTELYLSLMIFRFCSGLVT